MKIWIQSCHDKKDIERVVKNFGARISRKSPDFIICYGGDGTILEAERMYPGVPKIPVKFSRICAKCPVYSPKDIKEILLKLKRKEYDIKEEEKVEAVFKGEKLAGLNEVQVHNAEPCVALRFSVSADGRKINVIGDGLIVSTAHGSTAYFSSVGGKPFRKGLMLALINPVKKLKPFKVKFVRVRILKENALLIADNNRKMLKLKPGDVVLIKASGEKAGFIVV